MDVSAPLPAELQAVLSDVNRSLTDADARFQAARSHVNAQLHAGQSDLETVFLDSLKLKTVLDELEARSHDDTASLKPEDLAMTLNCEYQLYSLNSATQIRYNPFLSHWVEAVERWETDPWLRRPDSRAQDPTTRAAEPLTWWHVQKARMLLIEHILRGDDDVGQLSPAQLARAATTGKREGFDVSPFIKILEEEGIYERSQSRPKTEAVPSNAKRKQQSEVVAEASSYSRPSNSLKPADFKSTVMSRLFDEPETAHHTLTHLPIDLPSLDLITTMVQEGTYSSLHLDPALLIRDYIQHSLRTIERMGQSRSVLGHEGIALSYLDDASTNPGGREEQIRAVKLLVLFMRNLVRKALLPPEELYFEIQEICVRYIWIREVRDFKSFLEGVG